MLNSISSLGIDTSQVWSGASMQNYSQSGASNFFNSVDTNRSGSITQSQFEQALKTNQLPAYAKSLSPTEIWSKLDPKGTGSVTKQDFLSGLKTLSASKHKKHHNNAGESPSQTINNSLKSLNSLPTKSTAVGSIVDASV